MHVGLVGQLVGLARIAADTRGDNVLPSRPATFVAGEDVVEVQLGFRQHLGAVLTGELVAQEDIATGEFHFEARQFVIDGEDDDFRRAEAEADAVNHAITDAAFRVANPGREVVSGKAIFSIDLDDLGVTEAEEVE